MQAVVRALEEGDVKFILRNWSTLFPAYPAPKDEEEAEITLHVARTAAQSVQMELRNYSHKWLMERGYPSMLPQHLREIAVKGQTGIGVSLRGSIGQRLPVDEAGEMESFIGEAGAHEMLSGGTDKKIRFAMNDAREKIGLRRI